MTDNERKINRIKKQIDMLNEWSKTEKNYTKLLRIAAALHRLSVCHR